MAKWEQWLNNGTQSKEKFHSKYSEQFDDGAYRPKKDKRRNSREKRRDYNADAYEL